MCDFVLVLFVKNVLVIVVLEGFVLLKCLVVKISFYKVMVV